jgi:hypothetical protein
MTEKKRGRPKKADAMSATERQRARRIRLKIEKAANTYGTKDGSITLTPVEARDLMLMVSTTRTRLASFQREVSDLLAAYKAGDAAGIKTGVAYMSLRADVMLPDILKDLQRIIKVPKGDRQPLPGVKYP